MSAAEAAYAEALGEAARVLPHASWLEPMRVAARDLVSESGLPHRRLESWRWTDLRTMLDTPFPPRLALTHGAGVAAAPRSPFAALDRSAVVFVDGEMRPDLSDWQQAAGELELCGLSGDLDTAPTWVRAGLGQGYGVEGDAVAALNGAFFADGMALRVPAGTALSRPLEFCFHATATEPQTLFTRLLVVVEAGASATLIETHRGADDGRYVANSIVEIVLEEGARLDHVRLQDEGEGAVHLANVHASIGAAATYNLFTLNAGARVARHQIFARLDGQGGHVDITGAYMLAARQHCDTSLRVDHAVAQCTSNELFKCVMDGHARGVFQGKIIVRPHAQKTDGMQMSQALLLSETAEFDAKPELEIFADDVRCTHGATSGELDEDLMFYLRSRGIPETEARTLLIAAFVGEAIDKVADEGVREILHAFAAAGLERQGGS